jgi:hypothetical protein
VRPLSAVDAISPAWEHTRRLLLDKRDWRLLLKIGAVAVFAEAGGCNNNLNFPSHAPVHHPFPAAIAAIAAFALLIGLVVLLIGLALFYLSSRLQFVLFDVVLRGDTTVAPIWRRFGSITWRWMGLKLLFLLAALFCIAPLLIPALISLVHSIHANQGQSSDPAAFILTIFGFIASIFIFILLFAACHILLHDFGLPSMALENATIGLTVSRILRLLRNEPGQVLLYLLMHFLMRIAGVIVGYFILGFALLIALIPFGGVGLALWLGLRHAGLGGHILMVAGFVVLGLILATLLVLASIMLFGYLLTFLRAYSLYFLGGRYPMIGDQLERFMPPPAYPPPPPGYAYPAQPPL